MPQVPLHERHCVPCEGGTPPLRREEYEPLLAQLQGWQVEEKDGHQELVKRFPFKDFVQAVDFVNRITPIAEGEGHHPDLVVGWGKVEVRLWTHAAGGLSENDFVLAAKIDRTAAA
jgi:4a-hydroxytetrahydrobiopterin dehydratase